MKPIGFLQRHLPNSQAAQTRRLKTHAGSPGNAERGSWQSRGADQIKSGIWDFRPKESMLGCLLKMLVGYTLKVKGNQKQTELRRPSLGQFSP